MPNSLGARALQRFEKSMRLDRARWDEDDRVRCSCVHENGKYQCLNSTRHPSGQCTDCREAKGER